MSEEESFQRIKFQFKVLSNTKLHQLTKIRDFINLRSANAVFLYLINEKLNRKTSLPEIDSLDPEMLLFYRSWWLRCKESASNEEDVV